MIFLHIFQKGSYFKKNIADIFDIGGNSDVGSKTGGFKPPTEKFKPPMKNIDMVTILIV